MSSPPDDGLPPLRGRREPREPERRRGPWRRRIAIGLGAVIFGFLSGFALRGSGPQLSTTGPPPDAHLGALATDDLLFRITSDLPSLMSSATLDYDGGDVLDQAFVADGELTFRPRDLSEGTHTLSFSMKQPFVPWPVRRSWTFTVDETKPVIQITGPTLPAVRNAPVTLSGRVNEPSTVTIDDAPVKVAPDGTFSLTYAQPPSSVVTVRAVDRAGNSRGLRTTIPLAPRPPAQPTRAVHMTAISWDTPSLREPVLAMLRNKQINAVELDLKDESGIVGYDSRVPLANQIGAVRPSYHLEEAVRTIHELGGRVVGRIVAFRDPVLAAWAWDHGARDEVIQAPDHTPYRGYGGFTNFANPVVRGYNIDIAHEAAAAGVDDILYDYVRRPDGPLDTMVFPGLKGGAQQQIVSFLGEAPFSALDAQTRTILQDELQRIWLETRPAVVFVTHNLLEAAFLADTVYLLSAGPGRIVQRYAVDVPRPRDEGDPRLVAIRQDMLHRMRAEVDTAAGRPPGDPARLIGAATE